MSRPGAVRARRVEVTDGIRALHTLARPDYAAAREVMLRGNATRSAEQWARAIFEDAPAPCGAFVVAGGTPALGLCLEPRPSPDRVLGWSFVTTGSDKIILEEAFRYGTAHDVVHAEGSLVLVATFVGYEKSGGRPVRSIAAPLHLRIIPYPLGRAASEWPRSSAA